LIIHRKLVLMMELAEKIKRNIRRESNVRL
jgi:hypothetical protein